MAAPASARERTSPSSGDTRAHQVFAALGGLTALFVLLQGLWAGLFLQYSGTAHRAARDGWMDVHARCGEVAIALALITTVWALLRLRSRRDLVIGAGALTVLLAGVAYVGGLISDDHMDYLIPLHIPLALCSLVLAVTLPLRALLSRGQPA